MRAWGRRRGRPSRAACPPKASPRAHGPPEAPGASAAGAPARPVARAPSRRRVGPRLDPHTPGRHASHAPARKSAPARAGVDPRRGSPLPDERIGRRAAHAWTCRGRPFRTLCDGGGTVNGAPPETLELASKTPLISATCSRPAWLRDQPARASWLHERRQDHAPRPDRRRRHRPLRHLRPGRVHAHRRAHLAAARPLGAVPVLPARLHRAHPPYHPRSRHRRRDAGAGRGQRAGQPRRHRRPPTGSSTASRSAGPTRTPTATARTTCWPSAGC